MKRSRDTTPPNPFGITACEAAALDAIIATRSFKGAARQLHLSERTVEAHSQTARKKLTMHGRTQMYLVEWDRWRRANPEPEVQP